MNIRNPSPWMKHYNEGDKVMAIVDGLHKPAAVLYPAYNRGGLASYMLEIDATGARGVFDIEHITDYHD